MKIATIILAVLGVFIGMATDHPWYSAGCAVIALITIRLLFAAERVA